MCDTPDSLYTAVATFTNGGYPADGLAGVFVGCTPTSVKVGTCSQASTRKTFNFNFILLFILFYNFKYSCFFLGL